jgi:hypothetical protein
LKIKNTTKIPDALIQQIAEAVAPPGTLAGLTINVRNKRRGWHGWSYHGKRLIAISMCSTDVSARHVTKGGNGYLPMCIGSRVEALVVIIAHELRHQWQNRVPRGRRVWGARGQHSERDADAYALGMLRKFRRGELGTFAALTDGEPMPARKVRPSAVDRVKAACAKIGATMGANEYEIDAPDGKQFRATNTHYLAFDDHTPRGVRFLLTDLAAGLEDCPEGCDCRSEVAA